ncbi:hypothetical protein [Leptolyngbya sp. FACHB-261]|nr:hypothetical protein [Leptolyngbya sp. FACHB-261]
MTSGIAQISQSRLVYCQPCQSQLAAKARKQYSQATQQRQDS